VESISKSLDSIFTKSSTCPLFGAYREMFNQLRTTRERDEEKGEDERNTAIPENKSPLIS